ncbi:MAG: hypothetical protein ACP5KP_02445 [Candidatus Micrarchaeia archaeon]
MRGVNKLALAALFTGAAVGLGAPKARAAQFPTQDPIVSEVSGYNQYDWGYMSRKAALIAESLNTNVIPELYKELQNMENKDPHIMGILSLLSPIGFMDRIGDQPSLAGRSATPTTAITWVMDIFDIDTFGAVQGVKVKEKYREMAVQIFGEEEVAKLECALSTLFSNTPVTYRVDYSGPNSLDVQSVQEPNPVPEWLNSLGGKYAYMIVALVAVANGYTPEKIGQYKKEYDQKYKDILIVQYKLQCANEAVDLAEWLEENANNPDSAQQKSEKFNALQNALYPLGIYISLY